MPKLRQLRGFSNTLFPSVPILVILRYVTNLEILFISKAGCCRTQFSNWGGDERMQSAKICLLHSFQATSFALISFDTVFVATEVEVKAGEFSRIKIDLKVLKFFFPREMRLQL